MGPGFMPTSIALQDNDGTRIAKAAMTRSWCMLRLCRGIDPGARIRGSLTSACPGRRCPSLAMRIGAETRSL